MLQQPFLKVFNANMTYFGDYLGLDNINFEVDTPQSVVFWGEKFFGKTNLLKAICGLEKLSSGSVEFCGTSVTAIDAKERNFGFTFDTNSLFQRKTVGYNITYPLCLRKVEQSEIDTRLQKVAQSFGLTELLDVQISQLSPKDKSLTLLARVFVRDCKLYLIDNIFESLAEDDRHQAFELFYNYVKSNNLSVVFCTDNFQEAMRFDCKLGILNNCKLVDFGSVNVMKKNMRHLQVEKCFYDGEYDIEVGRLSRQGDQYFVVGDSENGCEGTNCGFKIATVAPIDNVYLNKEVVFLKNDTFIYNYYDLASEYRVSASHCQK